MAILTRRALAERPDEGALWGLPRLLLRRGERRLLRRERRRSPAGRCTRGPRTTRLAAALRRRYFFSVSTAHSTQGSYTAGQKSPARLPCSPPPAVRRHVCENLATMARTMHAAQRRALTQHPDAPRLQNRSRADRPIRASDSHGARGRTSYRPQGAQDSGTLHGVACKRAR